MKIPFLAAAFAVFGLMGVAVLSVDASATVLITDGLTGVAMAMTAMPAPAAMRRGVQGVYAESSQFTALSQAIKDAQASVEKTFEDFKAANDERISALEAGRADAVTEEKVNRINADVTKQLDELKRAIDDQARATARLSVGGGGASAEAENARKFFAKAKGRRIGRDEDVDISAYRAYRDAFDAMVRRECNVENVSMDVRAALIIGSDRDGGYLVPTEVSNEMERRIHDSSPMRQIARVVTIGSSAWEAPYKSSKGVSGGWVGERQARPATGTGAMGMQRIEVHEQYAYPEVTQSMLDDASIDVESFLVEDTEEQMSRDENTAFVTGNGVMKPRGFLDYKGAAVTTNDDTRAWGKLQYVATGQAGGFATQSGIPGASDGDCLIDVVTKLNPGYRAGATWTMNRATEAEIRKMKDGDGRYLVGMGSIEGALSFQLHGFPIVNFEDMPNIGSNTFSVAFGNFRRGYYVIDRIGFRVLRDPYTNKPYVGFYITKRTGGDVRNFDAIKLLKFGTS